MRGRESRTVQLIQLNTGIAAGEEKTIRTHLVTFEERIGEFLHRRRAHSEDAVRIVLPIKEAGQESVLTTPQREIGSTYTESAT